MGIQVKKKARSFSLDDEEFARVLKAATRHRVDRNDYLMKMVEADEKSEAMLTAIAQRTQPAIADDITHLCRELGIDQKQMASVIIHALWFELKRLWLDARRNPDGLEHIRAAFERPLGVRLALIAGNLEMRGETPALTDLVNAALGDEPQAAVASPRAPYGKAMTSLSEAVAPIDVPAPTPPAKKKSRDSTQHG